MHQKQNENLIYQKASFFFRIDDVGDWKLDGPLLRPLLDHFLFKSVPFNLQIIPTKLTPQTANYLNDVGNTHGQLIEIDQHGYSHNLEEFTHDKGIQEQINLIEKGRKIILGMFPCAPVAFTPPEHIYSVSTIKAIQQLGFLVFSKQFKPTLDGMLFYKFGKFFKLYFLLGKKISYHGNKIPRTETVELSISIESSKDKKIKSLEKIKNEVNICLNYTSKIGILIHHDCLNEKNELKKIVDIIDHIHEISNNNIFKLKDMINFR